MTQQYQQYGYQQRAVAQRNAMNPSTSTASAHPTTVYNNSNLNSQPYGSSASQAATARARALAASAAAQRSLGATPEVQLKNFIHYTRKSLNISQRELSKMSGVNQSNLSKIENGIINPSIATIQKVAACLGHKLELRFVPTYNETYKP